MTSNKSGRQDTEATFNLIEPNDKDNPNKGALLFFNMIPVVEGTYKSAFKAYGNYTSYISLLKKQQEIMKENLSEITSRFTKALKYSNIYKSLKAENKDNPFYKNYLDFKLLLEKSKHWSLVHTSYNYLDIYTKLPNINLKSFNIFNKHFNTVQNKKYIDVFRFSSLLTDAPTKFNEYKKYITFINNDIKEQEIKKIDPPIIKTFKEYKNLQKQIEEKQKLNEKSKEIEREK